MNVNIENLKIGDRVQFIRETNPNIANDDPFYEPPVLTGMTAEVVSIKRDYIRILLDDRDYWPEAITIWKDGVLSEAFTNTVSALVKI